MKPIRGGLLSVVGGAGVMRSPAYVRAYSIGMIIAAAAMVGMAVALFLGAGEGTRGLQAFFGGLSLIGRVSQYGWLVTFGSS
jgi:hypothetical protein